MISKYATILDREIHYTEWGNQNEEIVLMWHGLFRTGRDFDDVASHLCDRFRVICPDVVGRGMSEWSPCPKEEYNVAYYAKMAEEFVACLGTGSIRWIGTSLGGIIGMQVAAGALRSKISHLILNDVGPRLSGAAIEHIRSYGSHPPGFDRLSDFERYLRTIYAAWGKLTDTQWRHIAETSHRRTSGGQFTTHYDPSVAKLIPTADLVFDMWEEYDKIVANTLCIRGEESQLLQKEVVAEMQLRGPRCRVETVEGVGHAPPLYDGEQLAFVRGFLES